MQSHRSFPSLRTLLCRMLLLRMPRPLLTPRWPQSSASPFLSDTGHPSRAEPVPRASRACSTVSLR